MRYRTSRELPCTGLDAPFGVCPDCKPLWALHNWLHNCCRTGTFCPAQRPPIRKSGIESEQQTLFLACRPFGYHSAAKRNTQSFAIRLSLVPLKIHVRTGSSGSFAPLPPRDFAKCLSISEMIGRGGGDRTHVASMGSSVYENQRTSRRRSFPKPLPHELKPGDVIHFIRQSGESTLLANRESSLKTQMGLATRCQPLLGLLFCQSFPCPAF